MSSDTPIKKLDTNVLEAESKRAVEATIAPWTCTWLPQADDFGRDGVMQLFDPIPGENASRLLPPTPMVQLKAHDAPLSETHAERFETRHLQIWSADDASTFVMLVWSRATGELRCRIARDVIAELNANRPDWRTQETTTVLFRTEHAWGPESQTRETLRARIIDDADRAGGRSRFHKQRRRVMLTDFFEEAIGTFTDLAVSENGIASYTVRLGSGWQSGDLDFADVHAPRVLSGALLLYEEVWVSEGLAGTVFRCLGWETYRQCLRAGRIVIYTPGRSYGVKIPLGESNVSLIGVQPDGDKVAARKRYLTRLANELSAPKEFIDETLQSARSPTGVSEERILAATSEDLAAPRIRELVGLSRVQPQAESVWNAALVNRLLQLNHAAALADTVEADVLELEGGLSRIASEKWFSKLGFSRFHPTSDAFDSALREGGVPDLGTLAYVLGTAEIARMSLTDEAQQFRDWFWRVAAETVATTGDLRSKIVEEARNAFGIDAKQAFPDLVRLRFVQKVHEQYQLGSSGNPETHGFSSRTQKPHDILARQRRNHAIRRVKEVESFFGARPQPNSRCPCNSSLKFKFCCGVPG